MGTKELKNQIHHLVEQIPGLKAAIEPTPEDIQKVKELQSRKENEKKSLQEAEEKTKGLQEEIDELQTQIMDCGGNQVHEQKKKVEEITQQLDKVQQEITKITVGTESGNKKIENSKKDIKKS